MNKNANTVIVEFNNKKYRINKLKLQEVISRLENNDVVILDDNKTEEYLEKYKLYDEVFLEGIM